VISPLLLTSPADNSSQDIYADLDIFVVCHSQLTADEIPNYKGEKS
jgi:hypothetical protein